MKWRDTGWKHRDWRAAREGGMVAHGFGWKHMSWRGIRTCTATHLDIRSGRRPIEVPFLVKRPQDDPDHKAA